MSGKFHTWNAYAPMATCATVQGAWKGKMLDSAMLLLLFAFVAIAAAFAVACRRM